MQGLVQDVRLSVRMLRRSPGFAAAAIATLALGIGANTAIFTMVRSALLTPLPYPDPGRLMVVAETVAGEPTATSYPNLQDWRAQNDVFSGMAAFSSSDFILSGTDRTERVFGELVDDGYFPVLGVRPAAGRTFTASENRVGNASAVAIVSDALWRRRFGGERNTLGGHLRINDVDYTVVGIAPPSFRGLSDRAELWIPITMQPRVFPDAAKYDFLGTRGTHWHRVVARLKPGTTRERAQRQMETIQARLAAAYPRENATRGAAVIAMRDRLVRDVRAPLLILFAAVGLILLIACANVANLVLARASGRRREFALRRALGAGLSRLLRQTLTESVVLCVTGAAAGVLAARLALPLLVRAIPVPLPSFASPRLDPAVLAFSLGLALATAVLLGFLPTLSRSDRSPNELLKEGATSTTGRASRRTGGILVGAEVAFAVILLVGAGLLVKSLVRLLHADPGFRADHLVTLRFYVPNRTFLGDGRNRFGPDLADRIGEIPGVDSAAVTMIEPFQWGGIQRSFAVEGHGPISNAEADTVYYQEIGPGYFRTMGIPFTRGRDFSRHDDRTAPGVLVVSQSFARRYWPGQDALGKRVKFGTFDSTQPWLRIVGVAADAKFESLRQDAAAAPVMYGALLQSDVVINMNLVVRTARRPEAMLGPIEDAVRRFDPSIPVYDVTTLDARMTESAAGTRSYASLLGGFAAIALLLCGVGIAGVIGYWVSQRTRELGIRVALGATRADVLRLVIGEGARVAAVGLAAGVVAAGALTRLLTTLLFGVRPLDAPTFLAVGALLCGLVLAACWIPARRAARIDPMRALRDE